MYKVTFKQSGVADVVIDANEGEILLELAKKANMSLSHFLRRFKKATGATPVAFRNEQRIKAAKSLIKNSELNISQIAFTAGFSDSLYFSRAFKKSVGISPMDFKKSKQH